MELDADSLRSKMIHLDERISKVIESLDSLSTDLENEVLGALEKYREILNDLKAVEREYRALCKTVKDAAIALNPGMPVPLGDIYPMTTLRALLRAINMRAAEEDMAKVHKEHVMDLIDRMRQVETADQGLSEDMDKVMEYCDELQAVVDKLSSDSIEELMQIDERLSNFDHPLSAFIRLIEKSKGPSDDEIETLFERVKEAFGFRVATAALRGQLTISGEESAIIQPGGEATEPREEPGKPVHPIVGEERKGSRREEVAGKEQGKPSTALGEIIRDIEDSQEAIEIMPATTVGLLGEEHKETTSEIHADIDDSVDRLALAGEKATISKAVESKPIKGGEPQAINEEDEPKVRADVVEEQHIFIEEGVSEAASRLPLLKDEEYSQGILDLTLKLLIEGRYAESYWLARASEEQGEATAIPYPSWISEALSFLPYFSGQNMAVTNILRECYERYDQGIIDAGGEARGQALALLIFSATLRPALLAPHIGTSGMLRTLRYLPRDMYDLSMIAADCSDKGMAFYPKFLSMIRDDVGWEKQLEQLQERAASWMEEAAERTLIYQKASKLWRYWFKQGQPMFELLYPVSVNDRSRARAVAELVEELGEDKGLEKHIESTFEEMRISPRKVKVEARALRQIISHVDEALGIAREWLELTSPQADRHNNEMVGTARKEWRRIRTLLEKIPETLKDLDGADSLWMMAAKQACLKSCQDLLQYLEKTEYISLSGIKPNSILRRPLLCMKNWGAGSPAPIDEDWAPSLEELILNFAEPAMDLRETLEAHIARGRLDLAIELIETGERVEVIETREMREKLEAAKSELNENLQVEIERTREEIEEAVLSDTISEGARVEYLHVLEALKDDEIWDYEAASGKLAEIRAKIDENKAKLQKELEMRLDELSATEEDRSQVIDALQADDFAVANELLEMLGSKGRIETVELQGKDGSFEFFSSYDSLEKVLIEMESVHGRKSGTSYFKQGKRIGSIDLSRLTGANVREAERLIQEWFDLKQGHGDRSKTFLRDILFRIGFNPKTLDQARKISPERITYMLETDTTPMSPVHQFGSSANSRYYLLCLWGRPAEKDIVNTIKEYCRDRPTIVFFFGRLSKLARESLSMMAAKENLQFLIMDDVVLLYVCTVRGEKNIAFFSSTLPLLWVNPFLPEARANVPPEIFVGREQEIDSILDPRGSSFIFGGRQFGKSALLKNVMRQFHAPEKGKIAIYIDLKTQGIGQDRAIGEIWELIANSLKAQGIIPVSATRVRNRDRIYDYLRKWLSEDAGRRVLLLLDEADEFLWQDSLGEEGRRGDEFVNVSALKGWQDDTEGRLKLVFAGLHNVQRFWRIPNQPLAHLGLPLSIGPLKPKDAMNLIRNPFKAVGFEFESQNAIIRILSHTNYQPLLLQIFCDRLFRHMVEEKGREDYSGFPPYRVTSADVDAVYNKQDLRKVIKERFELTLRLDPWYELLAYIFAYYHVSGELDHKGLKVSDVESEAETWWKKGMEAAPHDWIVGLLDEMIGLGLLVRDDANRYRLRSPNVVRLLGSPDEIHSVLLTFEDRVADIERGPRVNRRRLGGQVSRRSPLTLAQEARILEDRNGVAVIVGSLVLGIDRVFEALEECSYIGDITRTVTMLQDIRNPSDLEREVDRAIRNAAKGLHIFIVPGPILGASMAEEAMTISTKKYSNRVFKVVFSATPKEFISWVMESGARSINELQEAGLDLIFLRPWDQSMMSCWCWDLEIAASQENTRHILDMTGGWLTLVEQYDTLLAKNNGNIERACSELGEAIYQDGPVNRLKQECGIDALWPTATKCITEIVEYDTPATTAELEALLSDGTFHFDDIFLSLEGLSLLIRDREDTYSVHPVVKRLLRFAQEKLS